MIRKTFLVFFLIAILIPSSVFAGTIQLPQTGQTTCYDASGTVINCSGTGQDGDLRAGAAWPNPRFTDNGDDTVADNLTGLMWTKAGNAPGPTACAPGSIKTWQGALDYVKCLNTNQYLGYTDWHLPNINELGSLVNMGQANLASWLITQGFTNVREGSYWSSTSDYAWSNSVSRSDWDKAYQIDMTDGYLGLYPDDTKSTNYYVWPTRIGSSRIVQLPQTGQTTCYDASGTVINCSGTGQDGDLRAGAAWPNPRFTDNGDDTVTDNLTGLMWTKAGNAPGPTACAPGSTKTWQGALDYVKCLNTNQYLGYTDWRLPNRREGGSLSNRGQTSFSEWATSQGFINVPTYYYWSSTTYANSPSIDWILSGGKEDTYSKSNSYSIWPVRGGPTGPVSGACGASNGGQFTSAPTTNLCNAGTASVVSGSGPWTWNCTGLHGGTTANCSASIQAWTVTSSAGSGGSITPNTTQTVNHGSTKIFTITPDAGHTTSIGGTCGGVLNGNIYTTNTITGNCTVVATFTEYKLDGICGLSNNHTLTSIPTINLCSAGTSTLVTGNGPWSWSCAGLHGGATANCSASFLILKGDLNGDRTLNLVDSILALKVMAGMNPANIRGNYPISGSDVNFDGKIGMSEAIYIMQFLAGLIAEVSSGYSLSGTITIGSNALSDVTVTLSGMASATATTDANGKFTFTSLPEGKYTITPSKVGYTFTSKQANFSGGDVVQDMIGVYSSPAGMILVSSGSFKMGDSWDNSELPVHTVTLSAFYMDKHEVTKALWDEVKIWATENGYAFDNAGVGTLGTHPVQTVSWYDVVKWLNARSEKEEREPVYYMDSGQTTVYRTGKVDVAAGAVKWSANGYRLPTEAEWEYAARAGTTTRFYTGDCISSDTQANYSGNSPLTGCATGRAIRATMAVGSFPANPWGFYDMAGNVMEWTWDWYSSYSSTPVTNPQGPASGSVRLLRGGAWGSSAMDLRSADRHYRSMPSYTHSALGFRSALSQP